MTADTRRNRPGRVGPGGRGRRPGPQGRRGRGRVAGERSAERRRRLEHAQPEPPTRDRPARASLRLPRVRLPTVRLPRLPRGTHPPRAAASRRLTAVLALLVLAGAVVLAALAVQLRNAEATESAATNAQVVAPRYAERLLSYHHAHLDRDFAAARTLLTDDFVREYTNATDEVREQALRDRAVIEARVVASSVVSAEPDAVRTLLFVNQTTTTRSGAPSIDLNRVELTLVQEDGRWLVDDLAAL